MCRNAAWARRQGGWTQSATLTPGAGEDRGGWTQSLAHTPGLPLIELLRGGWTQSETLTPGAALADRESLSGTVWLCGLRYAVYCGA